VQPSGGGSLESQIRWGKTWILANLQKIKRPRPAW
jgi:hypothetical protein